ncbi:O-methyltransferase [Penicillium canescens]|nr:O-methyltransferase [Penicillium canescens]
MATTSPQAKILQSQLAALDLSDSAQHPEIIQKVKSLITMLEFPGDKVMETYLSFLTFGCVVTANDLKLFKRLSQGPMTVAELAKEGRADQLLISRIMRALSAAGIVAEIGTESYAPTAVSNIFAGASYEGAIELGTLETNHILEDSF